MNSAHFQVEYLMSETAQALIPQTGDKPPYRVPSMAEIAAIPWNGFSVVSTFSGCGGSSLGYKMAGFRVLWANEFIPAAQEVYRLNHPATLLDTRDIRTIQPAEILDAIGLRVGDLDLFDGSPPCASFSTAGKRERGWGKAKAYSDTVQRVDDLFFEYARLIRGVQPKVFVAENVSGLVKGTAKGYFKLILKALQECGYTVKARLLDAQWLGVPQSRQRIIFVGVRNDLPAQPAFPMPLPYRYSVREAAPNFIRTDVPIPSEEQGRPLKRRDSKERWNPATVTDPESLAASDISTFKIAQYWEETPIGKAHAQRFSLSKIHPDRPCPTVLQMAGTLGAGGVTHPYEKRKLTIPELRRICSFPDDFQLTGAYEERWERLGRAVPPVMMMHIAAAVRDHILIPLREAGHA